MPSISRVIFQGRVQGVGFRYSVKELSKGFDLIGWVKNLPDGSVELQAKGDEVQEFITEIIEESDIAHHIKSHNQTTIQEFTEPASGFTIH